MSYKIKHLVIEVVSGDKKKSSRILRFFFRNATQFKQPKIMRENCDVTMNKRKTI